MALQQICHIRLSRDLAVIRIIAHKYLYILALMGIGLLLLFGYLGTKTTAPFDRASGHSLDLARDRTERDQPLVIEQHQYYLLSWDGSLGNSGKETNIKISVRMKVRARADTIWSIVPKMRIAQLSGASHVFAGKIRNWRGCDGLWRQDDKVVITDKCATQIVFDVSGTTWEIAPREVTFKSWIDVDGIPGSNVVKSDIQKNIDYWGQFNEADCARIQHTRAENRHRQWERKRAAMAAEKKP